MAAGRIEDLLSMLRRDSPPDSPGRNQEPEYDAAEEHEHILAHTRLPRNVSDAAKSVLCSGFARKRRAPMS